MWASHKLFPKYSLEVLKRKSLMKIVQGNRLWVHDQLRDLGRDIVRQRAHFKLEKQSRVWDHEELIDVLEIKEGRENVEAICLRFDRQFQDFIEKEESISLSKLRFLQVDCVDLDESNGQHFPSTNLCQRNLIMLPNLLMLSWHNFPVYFKFITICLKKLMILDLSRSEITDEWEGWNHLKMTKNLKVLNLTGCGNLHRTPDLSAHENLEQLILQGCMELVEVHGSIGRLKHLVLLNLKYCGKLQTLPDEMEEMEDLRELLLDGTSVTKIPEWNGMEKLETLSAASCRLLSELPLGNFGSLVELDLSCSSIRELPDSIETMKNLRILRIFDSMLEKLPSALGKLERLEEFYASSYGCLSGENPSEIGRLSLEKLEKIHASSCRYLSGEIPSEIGKLSFLRILTLSGTRISNIPKLPESLTELLPNLTGLKKLQDLYINDCPKLVEVRGQLESLVYFDLVRCQSLEQLPDPLSFKHIQIYRIASCWKVEEIQGLEAWENLEWLLIYNLLLLQKLPDLTNTKNLYAFSLEHCPRVVEIPGRLESLQILNISGCGSLHQFSDPLSLKNLECVRIKECERLEETLESDEYGHLKKVRRASLESYQISEEYYLEVKKWGEPIKNFGLEN
ncbi:hypothetical protein EUGRSUZ_J01301 [Eucalyptus grandis]|uniref:Uncharacterized protein n=2 Tax=Eucalyptus grandis TaxID=71139 RepID=A0ACC3K084_EUCGR|nr:hypothetical protein EUGRSUZ_J01301 [Eucalyptus grandis]